MVKREKWVNLGIVPGLFEMGKKYVGRHLNVQVNTYELPAMIKPT